MEERSLCVFFFYCLSLSVSPVQPHLQKQRGLEVSLRWVAGHWASGRHLKTSSEEGKRFVRRRMHRGRGKHQKVPEMSRGWWGGEEGGDHHSRQNQISKMTEC